MKRKAAYPISGLLTLAVFTFDIFTPQGYSAWIFYLIPLWIVSSAAKDARHVVSYASVITILIIAGLFISSPGISPSISVANRADGVIALWVLSFLNFRRKRGEDEIRQQAEMLRAGNRALAESEANLRIIFDSSHDALVIHDSEGRVLDVNRKMLDTFKVGYEQALSLSVRDDYSAPGNPLDTLPEIWRKTAAGEDRTFEWKCRRPGDGSAFDAEISLRRVTLKNREVVLAAVRDITERKAAQRELETAYREMEQRVRQRTEELAKRNRDLQVQMEERERSEDRLRISKALSDALNHINAIINSTLDPGAIMQQVVGEAARATGCESSALDTYENGTLTIRYVHNFPEDAIGRKFSAGDVPFAALAVQTQKPVVVNDAFNDPRAKPETQKAYQVRSVMAVPLSLKEKTFGILFFNYHSRIAQFTEEQVDFATKLSLSVSLALENAGLYQALGQSRQLAESRLAELRTIYETAPVGLCFTDTENRYISVNRTLAEINGKTPEEIMGRTFRDVIPGLAGQIEAVCNQVIRTGEPVWNREIAGKITSEQAEERSYLGTYYPVKDSRGRLLGVNSVVIDITSRKKADEALRASEQKLKAVLNSIPDMAWMKDRKGRFILVNEAYARSSRMEPGEIAGKTDYDVWPPEMAEKYTVSDREVIASGKRKHLEEQMREKDGTITWVDTIKTPVQNEAGEVVGTVGIARDMTERKRLEEEIRHMAQHDALTGLPNRWLFTDILEVEVAQARRHRSKLAILFLDLDRFKEVNDTLGHDVGDQLLAEVAKRLRKTIRESDTVARIGGDEFNIVMSDLGRVEDIAEFARKILDMFRKPFLIGEHELVMTTSIGISVFPDNSENIDVLRRYADIAMYYAKDVGRNTFQFYDASINIRSIQRITMENMLRKSIEAGELAVYYQPQIDIGSGEIRYAEALVRWNHPDRGILEPGDFLQIAEESGFIAAIDEWVLRSVCAQAAAWQRTGLGFCVTVNLSARRFQSPGLVPLVVSILQETGMRPDRLDLEVTETTAMSDVDRTALQLRELRDRGVHVSIDDFGTGYSSLNYLKKLPIERLKIDKSFIRDIAKDPDDRAIISAVSSMAHKMGLRSVAEGVETREQLEFLRAAECDEAQGFLFSRPVPAGKFRELVAAGSKRGGKN